MRGALPAKCPMTTTNDDFHEKFGGAQGSMELMCEKKILLPFKIGAFHQPEQTFSCIGKGVFHTGLERCLKAETNC